MEARPRSAMLALAMLVGQVAGFSQFPGAAPEEEGRSSRSSFDGTTGNLVIPNAPGVGKWGGTCVCPDGAEYPVGDKNNHCYSLACEGGTVKGRVGLGVGSGCNPYGGPWSGQKVICAPPVLVNQLRKSLGLSGVDGPMYEGGATGCSYKRPSDKTGCPLVDGDRVSPGCIESQPVPGQCAIFTEDIERVCAGHPMCGGVVCKPEYQFGGKKYCLARWGIDPKATDSGWEVGWEFTSQGWASRGWRMVSRREAYRRREAVRNYQGGATGCSYMSPGGCRASGCPILSSGCIEPPPVAGQCAIYEKDVDSVCGGDPLCGGVICREDYKHNGMQYCLARWGIDDTKTDSSPPDGVALVAAGRSCGTQAKVLGTTFSTRYQCGEAAAADTSCGSTFMYPNVPGQPRAWATWGCRCCVGNGEGGRANSNWDVYAVDYSATSRWAFAFDAMTTDGFPGGQRCTSFKPTIPRFDQNPSGLDKTSRGGATGCSYGSPGDGCRPTGCPMLPSGCIKPDPVPGQCAIYEKDVESVCGGNPMCGGVICRDDYTELVTYSEDEFDGCDGVVGCEVSPDPMFTGYIDVSYKYCLARWAIDPTATDDASSDNRRSSYTMPCS